MPYIGKQPSKVPLDSSDIADGTITNDDLAGSITSAKITSLDATKLTGTVASARMGSGTASSTTVLYGDGTYKAEPVTDTTSIKNDISLLALQNAINGNLSAYGLKNSWIEQFENSTFIENLSSVDRVTADEYVASVYTANTDTDITLSISNYSTYIDTRANDGVVNRKVDFDYSGGYSSDEMALIGDTYNDDDWWNNDSVHSAIWGVTTTGTQGVASVIFVFKSGTTFKPNGNQTAKWMDGSGSQTNYRLTGIDSSFNGTQLVEWVSGSPVNGTTYTESLVNSTFYSALGLTWTGTSYNHIKMNNMSFAGTTRTSTSANNATGSFNSTDVVPQDAVNKSSVGLVVLYKDNAGTNTLNTDIVAKVRANTGQAYQTLVLASAGTYSDSLKIAIAPAISVTAGQALSYEISFANQASGTKEARIYGVAMTY
jgi:hypothetical protein